MNQTDVLICRHIEGVTLNPLEFLLDNEDNPRTYPTKEAAIDEFNTLCGTSYTTTNQLEEEEGVQLLTIAELAEIGYTLENIS